MNKLRLVSARYEGYYPFDRIKGVNILTSTSNPDDLRPNDILVVWGGADIHPSLYKQPLSKFSGAYKHPSQSDIIEWNLMRQAVIMNIPIIGVCRGAQMLCALAGGTLVQHVNNHSGSHMVQTVDHKAFRVNSIHHQMMYPFDVEHHLIAWTPTRLSDAHYFVDEPIEMELEPEFVYFPQVKGIAVQWHPEMLSENDVANDYVINFINQKVQENVKSAA